MICDCADYVQTKYGVGRLVILGMAVVVKLIEILLEKVYWRSSHCGDLLADVMALTASRRPNHDFSCTTQSVSHHNHT